MRRARFARPRGIRVAPRTKRASPPPPNEATSSSSSKARRVYLVSGGVTKFAKAHPSMDFRLMVKRAYDAARAEVPNLTADRIDGSRISYFSDHFSRQLKASSMVQDYLGLNPKGSVRIEWGGATGGECFQAAYEAVASGRMDVCLTPATRR